MPLEIAANVLGLAGALALFVPAIYAARIVYRASRLDRRKNLIDDPEIETRRATAVDQILDLQNKWNRRMAICLFGGMAAGALSYALLLLHELQVLLAASS